MSPAAPCARLGGGFLKKRRLNDKSINYNTTRPEVMINNM